MITDLINQLQVEASPEASCTRRTCRSTYCHPRQVAQTRWGITPWRCTGAVYQQGYRVYCSRLRSSDGLLQLTRESQQGQSRCGLSPAKGNSSSQQVDSRWEEKCTSPPSRSSTAHFFSDTKGSACPLSVGNQVVNCPRSEEHTIFEVSEVQKGLKGCFSN